MEVLGPASYPTLLENSAIGIFVEFDAALMSCVHTGIRAKVDGFVLDRH